MTKYTTFLALFIISVVAGIVLMGIYLTNIFNLMGHTEPVDTNGSPGPFFSAIFNSPFIIAGLLTIFSSLAYRITGIVCVVRNKTIYDGEKALWIIGFVLMGFVTAIVFLVMARGRKFVE